MFSETVLPSILSEPECITDAFVKNIDKHEDKDLKELIKLMPEVLDYLRLNDQHETFLKFMKLLANKQMPVDNIAYQVMRGFQHKYDIRSPLGIPSQILSQLFMTHPLNMFKSQIDCIQ